MNYEESLKALNQEREQAIKRFCKRRIDVLVNKVIKDAQGIKGDWLLSGGQGVLKNLWDEYCVQLQDETGFGFDLQEDYLEKTCCVQLEMLKNKDAEVFGLIEVYLSELCCAESWVDFCLMDLETISELIRKKFVDDRAMNYTNWRIRYFLDHNYLD